MSFFPEIALSPQHAEAIARGLYTIAHADGLHEREAAIVASFWSDVGGSARGLADLARRGPLSPAELADSLDTPVVRHLFLKTALLMAFADGEVTGEESKLVRAYAEHLNMEDVLPTLELQVKEFMLAQLAHIHNSESLAEVAKKLAL